MTLLCEQIIRVLPEVTENDPHLDLLDLAWSDLDRRALQRGSRAGRAIRIILPAAQRLEHGAVIHEDGKAQLVVNLLPSPTLVIALTSPQEFAKFAYAIGNLHIPAQILPGELIVPADDANAAALERIGVAYTEQIRRFRPLPDCIPKVTLAMT